MRRSPSLDALTILNRVDADAILQHGLVIRSNDRRDFGLAALLKCIRGHRADTASADNQNSRLFLCHIKNPAGIAVVGGGDEEKSASRAVIPIAAGL